MNNCAIKPDTLAILASGVRLSPLQHFALRLNSLGAAAGPILREMLYGDPPQQSRERPTPHPRRPISVSLHGLSDAQIVGGGSGGPGDTPRVSQLRSLDLSQNDLGRAALDLAEGLLWNINLRSLTLRENRLQPASFAPFIECLGINRGLAHLDISRNPVCGPNPVVLEVLSKVVSQNQTLRGLFMSATGMTSEGAIILAECLPEQQRLERLDVSENAGIDMAGLMALSASIKLNRSLICVEITVNTGDDVCAALEQGIAQVCIANMQRLDTSAHSKVEDYEPDLPAAHVWTHADSSDDENDGLDDLAKRSTEIRPSADRGPSTDSRISGDSSCSNYSAANTENATTSGSTASLACGEVGCK
ncbi:RNI-like protein, partial [Coemansia reversa NRRL 1564]